MERLAFALDVDSADRAIALVDLLAGHAGVFKIGLELFTRAAIEGRDLIGRASGSGRVFLDLKLHDIPATMRGAVRSAAASGRVEYLTMHACDGAEAMRDSLSAAGSVKVLGVTVLTSVAPEALPALGFSIPMEDLVLSRARWAMESGCAGVVCSGHEAARVRGMSGPGFLVVVPGVRPSWDRGVQDQKRVVTPSAAIRAGADMIVVGRPIRDAADPAAAADRMVGEIEEALAAGRG